MERRNFLSLSAVGVLGALAGSTPALAASSQRVIYQLPKSSEPRWAWTIDDGMSPTSIATYLEHAISNPEIKYTFFVTSKYAGWKENLAQLRELMSRGQVQLGNHTYNHLDLRSISNAAIQKELTDCQHFLEDNFQVSGEPFWRPPYGYFDDRVLTATADIGFTAPVMWYGSFGTASKNLSLRGLVKNVEKWVSNGHIVIDHANYPLAAEHYEQIFTLIQSKNLKMVTLKEALPNLV